MSASGSNFRENTPNAVNELTEFTDILSAPEWRPYDDKADVNTPESEADIANTASQKDKIDPSPSILKDSATASADTADITEEKFSVEKDENQMPKMSLFGHLNELRMRLTRCCIALGIAFCLCWAVVDPIFNAFVDPLLAVLPPKSTAIYTTLPEGFFTRMFIALITSLFLASPVIFYQIWAFIAPGLYEEEKRSILPIAIVSALFFVVGGFFCYFVVFPYAFEFFVSFSTESIVVMPKVSEYLDFVLKLILAFGLIFEMPLFAFFLARLGLVTADMLRKTRRYAILVIFVLAAILTPPDVVSQLLMAFPMLILYEISILVAAAFGRTKPAKKTAAPTPPGSENT